MDFGLFDLVQLLGALVVISFLLILLTAHLSASKMVGFRRHEKEKYFLTEEGKREEFPFLQTPHSRELTVVVPSYNEQLRLPLMMEEAMEYLENRQKQQSSFTYEVIVVDDGSKDKTTEVALGYTKRYGASKVRVLTLVENRGKGGAVMMGTLSSRGKLILMADADGATKFPDLEKVEAALLDINPKPENMAISCGSRAHLEKESVAQMELSVQKKGTKHALMQGSPTPVLESCYPRSVFRTFLMYGFHFLVWFFCVRGIKDTQCGFKLFTREAALRTFSVLHVERWAFDVELLYIAQCLKIPIAEVAVNWTEIEGSKLVPFWSWLQMGRDLVFIRLRYLTGVWKLQARKKAD